MAYYHVRISTKSNPSHDEVRLDLSLEQLTNRFLTPYNHGKPITIGGKTVPIDDLDKIVITTTDSNSEQIRPIVDAENRASPVITSIPIEWEIADHGNDVTDDLITGPPGNSSIPQAPATSNARKTPEEHATIVTGSGSKDVFLCHASEDKADAVLPFAEVLQSAQISYWLDMGEIKWGDSLIDAVQRGITECKAVIVFISRSSTGKAWPEKELRTALNLEIGGKKKVLPIVLGMTHDEIEKTYPFIAEKKYQSYANYNRSQRIDEKTLAAWVADLRPILKMQPNAAASTPVIISKVPGVDRGLLDVLLAEFNAAQAQLVTLLTWPEGGAPKALQQGAILPTDYLPPSFRRLTIADEIKLLGPLGMRLRSGLEALDREIPKDQLLQPFVRYVAVARVKAEIDKALSAINTTIGETPQNVPIEHTEFLEMAIKEVRPLGKASESAFNRDLLQQAGISLACGNTRLWIIAAVSGWLAQDRNWTKHIRFSDDLNGIFDEPTIDRIILGGCRYCLIRGEQLAEWREHPDALIVNIISTLPVDLFAAYPFGGKQDGTITVKVTDQVRKHLARREST